MCGPGTGYERVCVIGLNLGHLLASVLPEETQVHQEPVLSSLCLLPSKSQSSLPLYSLSWEFNNPLHTLLPLVTPASSIWSSPYLNYVGAMSLLDPLRLVMILLKEKWGHILAIEFMVFASRLNVGQKGK